MLKVFLVEDEFVVREGIKNNIDWEAEGLNFCGEAADGELAFPLIQSEQPDIIITDIKMPFMNGLELSRLVIKELPQTKIIILSGHEEFSYAQEAIKIGVTEYLLKPIKGSDLIKSVKSVAEQIIKERQEKEKYDRYILEIEGNEADSKRKLFNDMVSGSLSIAKILEQGKKLKLELSAKYYRIMLFKYGVKGNDKAYSNELQILDKELKNIYYGFDNIIHFDRAIEGAAFLIKGESLEQIDKICEEYIIDIKAVLVHYPSICYFGGVGTAVGRLTLLPESYECAARAYSYRFITDVNAILNCDELSTLYNYNNNDPSFIASEIGVVDFKKVEAFLRNGEAEEITFFVEEFLKSIGSASEKSFLFKQYILMNTYFSVLTFLNEIGVTDIIIEEPFKGSEPINEMFFKQQKAKAYIVRVLTVAIESRDTLQTKRYQRMVDQVKEYINERYADAELSLNDAAAHVSISPSYFSAIFSRETGKSFIKYLTDLRMAKARELLKCSDMRCADISLEVGYKDPHYFSYLFKKIHNCSPTQYRI